MHVRARLKLLRLGGGQHVLEQLRMEEALYRSDARNWCILNRGLAHPRIVMGISGSVERLVDTALARSRGVDVIRRFTGGGTVVADEGTLFVSLICNKDAAAGAPQFPRELMRWSADFYAPIFEALGAAPAFGLVEQDYCLGERKCGGNAQTISRGRWVHHTSFLWDYSASNMELLRLPEKRPAYRRDREHGDFLARLSAATTAAGPDVFFGCVEARLREVFDVEDASLEEAHAVLASTTERQTNVVVPY